MTTDIRVVIADAYSRSNSGDGLLVDQSARLAREALPGAQLDLIAMSPASFEEFPGAVNPVSGRSESMPLRSVLRVLLTGKPHRSARRLLDDADLVLAVGGGYLRADTPAAALKSLISHASQGPRHGSPPYVYLPQSVGPLLPRWMHTTFERLKHADVVFVRDDRSAEECVRHGFPTLRMPDLAVLAVADGWPLPVRTGTENVSPRIGLVARNLRDRGGYSEKVRRMATRADVEVLVQSSGRGNDDPHFYEKLGIPGPFRSLREALASDTCPDVILSVRMHGALESILAGVPAVHLSYERKGWGAYDDLGISKFVHHAWRFHESEVEKQLEELSRDPSNYWDGIERRLPDLIAARSTLIEAIRAAASKGRPGA